MDNNSYDNNEKKKNGRGEGCHLREERAVTSGRRGLSPQGGEGCHLRGIL